MNRTRERKTSWLILIILIAVFLASFLIKYYHVKDFDGLLAFDPNYFMARTNYILSGHDPRQSAYDIAVKVDNYPFFMPLFIANLHNLTSIAVLTLYKILGPLLTSFLVFLMFIFLRRYFDDFPSALGAIYFVFAPVVLFRGQLTVAENLGLVFFLALLYCFSQNKSAENLALGLFFWVTWCATHLSAFYLLPIILIWLIISKAIFRFWKLFIPLLVIGISAMFVFWRLFFDASLYSLAIGYAKTFFVSNLYFAWPERGVFDSFLHFFILSPAIVGIPVSIYFAVKRRDSYSLIFAMTVFFVLILFVFHGTSKNMADITPDRMYPFVALTLAIFATFSSQLIFELNNALFVLYAVVFATLSIWPAKGRDVSWFEAYTPSEVEAAQWLDSNTPADSVIFSQPAMNRLISSIGQRYVLVGEEGMPTQILNLAPKQISAAAVSFGRNGSYVFISKQKLNQLFKARTTNGLEQSVGWDNPFQLYGLDLKKFANQHYFFKVFENDGVIIYTLI